MLRKKVQIVFADEVPSNEEVEKIVIPREKVFYTDDYKEEDINTKAKKTTVNPKKVLSNYVKTIPDEEISIADGVRLVISVAQKSADSDAHVDIRTWVESESYTGPTKKGINFNIEYLDSLIEILQKVSSDCSEMGM